MDDREREAVEWLRRAIAKREAGVQADKEHHRRSRCPFDEDSARKWAGVGGLTLDCAMALLEIIERVEPNHRSVNHE